MDSTEDREDLIQEIIAQLWKSYGQFRNESQFSTWMYKVSINTAITFFKKSKRRPDYLPIDEKTEAVSDSDKSDKNDKLDKFYKAVQSLNSIEKALIFLYLENQSHKQIAERLGISEVNARVRLNRTKEKLQQIIKQQQT